MRVLVTWGSKYGGTAGIGEMIAEALREDGHDVVARPAGEVRDLQGIDAVIVGGALYANYWHRDARRFVDRHERALRRVPVWFFSSGPLDDSATRQDYPPNRQARARMERVGALGHVTFGGRLSPDVKGFPAAAMAKEHAGDWRDPAHIRGWAASVSRALPTARPGAAVAPPGHSIGRLVGYGVAGWAACAVILAALLAITTTGAAYALRAVAVVAVFAPLTVAYERPRGAREPLATAAVFTALFGVLDAILFAAVLGGGAAFLARVAGFWLPLALVFGTTWVAATFAAMLPFPKTVPNAATGQATKPAPTSA